MDPVRTSWLIGDINPAAIAAAYACGHCNSTTELRTINGTTHVAIHHDDGCPVLEGTLTAAPDALRAATALPDTFRR